MPEMSHYSGQTRYSKMYVDWDDKSGSWNIHDAIGPLRITMLGSGSVFDVEVDSGERKRHPQELIRAASLFGNSIAEREFSARMPPPAQAAAVLCRGG